MCGVPPVGLYQPLRPPPRPRRDIPAGQTHVTRNWVARPAQARNEPESAVLGTPIFARADDFDLRTSEQLHRQDAKDAKEATR